MKNKIPPFTQISICSYSPQMLHWNAHIVYKCLRLLPALQYSSTFTDWPGSDIWYFSSHTTINEPNAADRFPLEFSKSYLASIWQLFNTSYTLKTKHFNSNITLKDTWTQCWCTCHCVYSLQMHFREVSLHAHSSCWVKHHPRLFPRLMRVRLKNAVDPWFLMQELYFFSQHTIRIT